jgi:hypothetical protein
VVILVCLEPGTTDDGTELLCFHGGVERRFGGVGKGELLAAAANYAVFDARGRRIGLVIELVDDSESGGQRLAIRRDGVVLWHRRLLPLDAVQTVDAERRFVVVDEDNEAARLAGTPEAPLRDSLARVYYYTRPESVRNGEDRAIGLEEEERSVTPPTPAVSDCHLRFVSTPNGYRLDEQAGGPPAVGTLISVIDLPEGFVVVKLGPSPLPHDSRMCAYLEREIPLAAPVRGR